MRRLLAMTLVFVMSAQFMLAATPAKATSSDYNDVSSHWANAEISKWSDLGILKGANGAFRPDDDITRGELAVVLDRVMDYQVTAKNSFDDLMSGQFYTDAILKANAAGIIKGSEGSDQRFAFFGIQILFQKGK